MKLDRRSSVKNTKPKPNAKLNASKSARKKGFAKSSKTKLATTGTTCHRSVSIPPSKGNGPRIVIHAEPFASSTMQSLSEAIKSRVERSLNAAAAGLQRSTRSIALNQLPLTPHLTKAEDDYVLGILRRKPVSFPIHWHPNCRCEMTPSISTKFDRLMGFGGFGTPAKQFAPIVLTPHTLVSCEIPHPTRGEYGGLQRMGRVSLTVKSGTEQRAGLCGAFYDGKPRDLEITLPDGEGFNFKAYVLGYKDSAPIDGVSECVVTVQPTGLVTMKEKKMRPTSMQKGLKSFYVGSNTVTPGWTKATLAEAEAQAKALVENGQQDEAFIVKIVKVVRRKPQPVVSEDFKGGKR